MQAPAAHTSTSTPFHLQRKHSHERSRSDPSPAPPHPQLGSSARTQMQVYTFAHRKTHTRSWAQRLPLTAQMNKCREETLVVKTLGVTRTREVLTFVVFAGFLHLLVQSGIQAGGSDGFHLSCIPLLTEPERHHGKNNHLFYLFLFPPMCWL